MAAPERASVGEVDERGHPYQDWLAVAAPSGDLELIAGGDGAHRNGAYRSDLAHRWPAPGETYFAAIRRVPPGHALVVEPGGTRVSRYWSPVADGDEVDWVTEDELDHFEELLETAVCRFIDLGPAGIYLSGGLDSVSVAAMAADASRRAGQPAPWALSLGFSHEEANEQAIQRGVASDL